MVKFLEEDIGAGDITSDSTIPVELEAVGEIFCKSPDSIISGLEEASLVFEICGCTATAVVKAGARVNNGKLVMVVEGKAKSILKAERTALNLIMRMSGIATVTHRLGRKTKEVRILATRKTAPGLRYFDKKAVIAGGGGAHRMRLDDMVLIKDNHLAIAGSPADCIKKARDALGTDIKIECEAKKTKEAVEAVRAGADIVMLDNFTPSSAANTIKKLSKMGLRKSCKIEVSGGVNERNIRQYARSKPDFISLGYITHSARAVDFSLELKPVKK